MSKHHPNAKPHPGDPKYVKQQYAARLARYRVSILLMIRDFWGLTPQPCKPEYRKQWEEVVRASGETWLKLKDEVSAEWFGDPKENADGTISWVWFDFQKGKHISWQQTMILLSIQKAVQQKQLSRHISVKSGHGIGKSAVTTWVVIWFLYCYFMSQVPVTAPTSGQMHDVLWKELAIWINRIKEESVKDIFEWQHDYIRIRYEPESWFARAKTSTKENTEALAGVHADHVLIAVDEASGVPEQVFNTAEGALTSGNVFVLLISNATRTMGYFYDSHNKNSSDWQTFSFNCEQSPLVDREYVKRQAKRHGVTSDEYRIRVKGEFPSEDMMDDSGYIQLIPRPRILVTPSAGDVVFLGRKILGIDPSGEGSDQCEFVLRDNFRAQNLLTLQTTNEREIAEWIIKFSEQFELKSRDIVVEAFGKGAEAAKHVAVSTKGKLDIYAVLPGNAPDYEERTNGQYFNRFPNEHDDDLTDLFLNIRAVMNWRMRNWLLAGGQIIDNNTEESEFASQIAVNKIKRTLQGNKQQMMPKQEMNKLRIPSPNKSDALALTFLVDDMPTTMTAAEQELAKAKAEADQGGYDRHSVL